ncbi:hypothetical protein ACQ4PT_014529 [Festuca glaucescens]
MEPAVPPDQPHLHLRRTARMVRHDRHHSPVWAWLVVIFSILVATGIAVAGFATVAVFVAYEPKKVHMEVTKAHVKRLDYGGHGQDIINDIGFSVDIVCYNDNARSPALFSHLHISVRIQGVEIAELRAWTFNVSRLSSKRLHYDVQAKGAALHTARARRALQGVIAGKPEIGFVLTGWVRLVFAYGLV